MDDKVPPFLAEHPIKERWLDDIIDVLSTLGGKGHVRDIARRISKSRDRDVEAMEQTITRCINNYCSDARDFDKDGSYDIFARIEPGTYRLRTYPKRPDIIEIIRIEFEDSTMQGMWDLCCDIAKKKYPERWSTLTSRQKLTIFVRQMENSQWVAEYARRKAAIAAFVDVPLDE